MFPVADREDQPRGITAALVQTNDGVHCKPSLVEASLDEASLR